jgi:hypothetical protein
LFWICFVCFVLVWFGCVVLLFGLACVVAFGFVVWQLPGGTVALWQLLWCCGARAVIGVMT